MNNDVRIRCLIAACFIVAGAAQAESGVIEQPSIAAATLQILNTDTSDTPFQINCYAGAGWENMNLGPQSQAVYYCQGNPVPQSLGFRLVTQKSDGVRGGTVEYGLDWSNRYEIVYNGSKQLWDIVRVAR